MLNKIKRFFDFEHRKKVKKLQEKILDAQIKYYDNGIVRLQKVYVGDLSKFHLTLLVQQLLSAGVDKIELNTVLKRLQ